MMKLVDEAKKQGDTLGGIFEVVAKNVVVGLGSHTSWSEKLDGRIAQAFMSIQAVKAVEIGSGVENAENTVRRFTTKFSMTKRLFSEKQIARAVSKAE